MHLIWIYKCEASKKKFSKHDRYFLHVSKQRTVTCQNYISSSLSDFEVFEAPWVGGIPPTDRSLRTPRQRLKTIFCILLLIQNKLLCKNIFYMLWPRLLHDILKGIPGKSVFLTMELPYVVPKLFVTYTNILNSHQYANQRIEFEDLCSLKKYKQDFIRLVSYFWFCPAGVYIGIFDSMINLQRSQGEPRMPSFVL